MTLEKNKQTNNNNSNNRNNKNKSKRKKKKKKKNNKKKKKKSSNNRKMIPSQTQPISKGFLTSSLPVSMSKICLLSTIHLRYGIMLSVMGHVFVKVIVFIDLIKAVPFSIGFTFRIFTMRLFKFMNFFLWT